MGQLKLKRQRLNVACDFERANQNPVAVGKKRIAI
jgi:hypothetical protein